MAEIFETPDYKSFLRARLPTQGAGRGSRSRLAEALGCQTAFVSLVLNGDAHFSLEHGVAIADHLGMGDEERNYFLLLLHRDRAGTTRLRSHYQGEMDRILRARRNVQKRLKVSQTLGVKEQMEYYSSWHHSAVHVMLALPQLRTADALVAHTGLSRSQVESSLALLARTGLADRNGGEYRIGRRRIHLAADSPMIRQHHVNWRLKAMQALEITPAENQNNLHYSAVFALSREDFQRVRALLLEALSKMEPIISPSPEETVAGMSLDWFEV